MQFPCYYRALMNPLDYKNILSAERVFLQKNKRELAWSHKTYQNTITALNEAIAKSHAETRKALKRERALFNKVAKELPFYFTEINTKGVWADVKENISESRASFGADLTTLSGILTRAGKKGIRYVTAHPLQAITTILATQVVAATALNVFTKSSKQAANIPRRQPAIVDNKQAVTNEFKISQNSTTDNIYDSFGDRSSIVALPNGNAFIAWTGQQNNNWDIYGRVVMPNGLALADEFIINQNTASDQHFPALSLLQNKNIFAVWDGLQTGNWAIYGRILAPNGTAATDEFRIDNDMSQNQYRPSAAILSNGNVFIAWQIIETHYHINGRVMSSNGTYVTDQFSISTSNYDEEVPFIAPLSNGSAFVGWEDQRVGISYNIYGQVMSANGTAEGVDFPISDITASPKYLPSGATFSNGNVFVAWSEWLGVSTTYNTSGSIMSSKGTPVTGEFTICQNSYDSTVVIFPNDDVFVGFTSPPQQNNGNIYGRLMSNAGTALTDPVMINQYTPSDLDLPSAVLLSNGNIFITWIGFQTGNWSLYGRIIPRDFFGSNHTTTGTTGTSPPPSSSKNNSSAGLIAGLVVGLGGTALLAVGAVLGRKYYLTKCSSQNNEESSMNMLELASAPSSLFAPSEEGFITRPSVKGTLNKTAFYLWEQITAKEASSLEKILYRKIPFTPDTPDQNEMTFYLGKGQFGETFLASNLATNELVAVKRIRGDQKIQESLKEGQLQNQLKDSPHIMSLLDYLHFTPSTENVGKESYLFQFMPLGIINGVAYKTLTSSLANQNPALHQRLLATHTYQLLKGLNFMHNQGIYHSDMKDANVLFMPDFSLKIADFGRAMELGKGGMVDGQRALGDRRKFAPEQVSYIRHLWKQDVTNTDTGSGEVVSSYAAGPADLWSGALFMLETLAENEPFNESTTSFNTKVTKWSHASFQKVIDEEKVLQDARASTLTGVIKELLRADPEKRLNADKALKQSVFRTLKPLNEEEGADLLKSLMNALTTTTISSKNFEPYAAISQPEKDAYYNYHSSAPSSKNENFYGENPKEEIHYNY